MKKRTRVAVIFGGKSGEHDVSLLSAASVIDSIDLDQYEVVPMQITKEGDWKTGRDALPALTDNLNEVRVKQIEGGLPAVLSSTTDTSLPALNHDSIDVVFPVLHGTYGEDGTIQGLLEMLNLPYVGAGVLASAAAMDKVIAKKLFAQAGLPQAEYTHFTRHQFEQEAEQIVEQVETRLGYPCFIKPANLGSSVGVSKAGNRAELVEACQLAAKYDRKIVIEAFVPAREIEVAVLGNDQPQASMPGEIVFSNDFYDYHAKYVDGGLEMQIPAKLPENTLEKIRELAIQAYQAVECTGLARVDFFVRKDNGQILLNELNTMPGFTQFSMYPKMWEQGGLSYSDLITQLIQLGLERYKEKQKSSTDFEA